MISPLGLAFTALFTVSDLLQNCTIWMHQHLKLPIAHMINASLIQVQQKTVGQSLPNCYMLNTAVLLQPQTAPQPGCGD